MHQDLFDQLCFYTMNRRDSRFIHQHAVDAFAVLLEDEVKRWPEVRTGKMFGMVSVYRGDRIFALLPASRSLEGANSIMIKRERPAESEGKKWDSLEVLSEADFASALTRLDEAYSKARG